MAASRFPKMDEKAPKNSGDAGKSRIWHYWRWHSPCVNCKSSNAMIISLLVYAECCFSLLSFFCLELPCADDFDRYLVANHSEAGREATGCAWQSPADSIAVCRAEEKKKMQTQKRHLGILGSRWHWTVPLFKASGKGKTHALAFSCRR